MKPYGIHSKQSGVAKDELEDTRKARRWNLRNRSVSPKPSIAKVWKKRARRNSKKMSNEIP